MSVVLSKEAHDEQCVTFAALLLHDAEAEITSEKLMEVIVASGNEVEPYWPTLFASLLNKEGVDIQDLILKNSAAGGGGGVGGGGGGDGAAAVEEEAAPAAEEEEVDVGGGALFGDADGY